MMEQQARIIINRPSEWANRARPFKIMIDGEQAGIVKNGIAEEIKVAPGKHTVYCKVDWCSSKPFEVNLAAGETEYLEVKSGMKYYYHFVIPLVVVLLYNFILVLSKSGRRPMWFNIVLLVTALPALSYIFYYLTIGRSNYLQLARDEKGFLSS
jgi:hypothetical protein